MRLSKVFLICAMVLGLLAGCSDKQEDAEALEQQMREMEGQVDTGAEQMTDTMVAPIRPPARDASAIPDEDEEMLPEDLPMAPMSGGYTVQVAACQDEKYARHLVTLYRDRGYEPTVMMTQVGGATYYRIRIGNLDSIAEATALRNELKDRFSINPWLARHGQ